MAQPEFAPDDRERHQFVVRQMADFYQPFMDISSDGIIVYLDDEHKICNENAANMFGYSVDEWSALHPFLDKCVAPESRTDAASAYRETRDAGVSKVSELSFLHRDGSKFRARIAVVPVMVEDDFFTINLIRQV